MKMNNTLKQILIWIIPLLILCAISTGESTAPLEPASLGESPVLQEEISPNLPVENGWEIDENSANAESPGVEKEESKKVESVSPNPDEKGLKEKTVEQETSEGLLNKPEELPLSEENTEYINIERLINETIPSTSENETELNRYHEAPNRLGNISTLQDQGNETLQIPENVTYSGPYQENTPIIENGGSSPTLKENNEITESYIDLEKIIGIISINTEGSQGQSLDDISATPGENDPTKQIKEKRSLYKDGKIELEVYAEKDKELKIEKIESILPGEDWIKEVAIKSQEHIEGPIIAFSKIEEVQDPHKISIFWKNENRAINILDFYDENENGLYDTISWEIPHLSEQYFEIKVEKNLSLSSEPEIKIIKAPLGVVSNPIEFKFEVSGNYSEEDCKLSIDSWLLLNNSRIINLENGDHTWEFLCSTLSKTGTFRINESAYLSLQNIVYLIGENPQISLYSEQNSQVILGIKNQNVDISQNQINLTGREKASLTLNSSIFKNEGRYLLNARFNHMAQPFIDSKAITFASALLDQNKNKANALDNVTFKIRINATDSLIEYYTLDYGDSSQGITRIPNSAYVEVYENHQYSQKGNYTSTLTFKVGGRVFSIRGNNTEVSNNRDSSPPVVTLLSPNDGEVIKANKVTFSYKAEDNVKLKNCTFELYNYSGILGQRIYTLTKENPQNNQEEIVELVNFEEGHYSWFVKCSDNSSNYAEEDRDLHISFSNSTTTSQNNLADNPIETKESKEAGQLISEIDSFLSKEESYSLDKKQFISDMDILTKVEYYKTRLMQIKRDLEYNLKFIIDTNQRESRKKELLEEIKSIGGNIPKEIEIIETYDYIKNSIPESFSEILKEYLEAKNVKISTGQLKALTEANKKIQNELSVSTKLKRARISYLDGDKEITLITKDIEVRNATGKIIEYIPKEVSKNAEDFNLISKLTIVKNDPIFETEAKSSRIIYYLNKSLDLKEIEKTETFLFQEIIPKPSWISGLAVSDFGEASSLTYYLVAIILLAFGIYLASGQITSLKIKAWKKEINGERVFNLIKECKKDIAKKEISLAKERYHEMQRLYPLLKKNCQSYIFKEIKRILPAIHKEELNLLLEEYAENLNKRRKEEAKEIYDKIKRIYDTLDHKEQLKVYERVEKIHRAAMFY